MSSGLGLTPQQWAQYLFFSSVDRMNIPLQGRQGEAE